jgi:hypothetical protein
MRTDGTDNSGLTAAKVALSVHIKGKHKRGEITNK